MHTTDKACTTAFRLVSNPQDNYILGVKSYRIEKYVNLVNLRKDEFQYSSEIGNSSPAHSWPLQWKEASSGLDYADARVACLNATMEQLRIYS